MKLVSLVDVGDLVFWGLAIECVQCSVFFYRFNYQCRRFQCVSCISFESVLSNVSANSSNDGGSTVVCVSIRTCKCVYMCVLRWETSLSRALSIYVLCVWFYVRWTYMNVLYVYTVHCTVLMTLLLLYRNTEERHYRLLSFSFPIVIRSSYSNTYHTHTCT